MDPPLLHGVPAEEALEIAQVKEAVLPSVPDIDRVQDHQCQAVHPLSAEWRNTGTRRNSVGCWTEEEDAKLGEAVRQHKGKNWKMIATNLPGRTAVQCKFRWKSVLDPNHIKGQWTKEEDNLIVDLVEEHGEKQWALIAKSLPGRIGKQCRQRWYNYLRSGIVRTPWTEQEDSVLMEAHAQCGNKWAEFAKLLPGRSKQAIKSHWNQTLSKRVNNKNVAGRRPASEPSNSGNSDMKDLEELAQPQVGDYLSSFGATHEDASRAICEPTTKSDSRDCLGEGAEFTVPVEESSLSPNRDLLEAPKRSETAPADSSSGLSLNFASRAITESSAFLSTPLHNTGQFLEVSCPESTLKSAAKRFPKLPSIRRKYKLPAAAAAAADDSKKDSSGCVTMQVSGSSPTLSKKRVNVSGIRLFGKRLKCELDIVADELDRSTNSNDDNSSGVDMI
ncbi:hypothetical protein MLD38_020804 [Melastoma candidum]|uniref:Uncharacterized protein n=1 Tax=Melastoma candidum TaxID=119954 RepID=A0ACB9QE77_9MYRT|nr:hypothetical protein MLD38_020804 [Melastoma candidum]